MASIFLDANAFFDVVLQRRNVGELDVDKNRFCISVLTIHVFTYSAKKKVPNKKLDRALGMYQTIPLSRLVALKSLSGPTPDFEDNVQLHSAVEADCDLFLTNDTELLKLAYFGKIKIVGQI